MDHAEPVLSLCFQGKELLSQKIPVWQQVCAEPTKLPDRAMFLAQQMSGAAGGVPPGALHPCISEPISGAKPLPMPPELAALRAGATMGQQVSSSWALPHQTNDEAFHTDRKTGQRLCSDD